MEGNGSTTFRVSEGFRAGGTTYRRGSQAPIRYKSQLERPSQARDPGVTMANLPPNAGRPIVPHIWTFSGKVSTIAQTYRHHDEAIRHSVRNAHAMLLDPMISGPLFARQTAVSLLNWSIESEDDRDPVLKEIASQLTSILEQTPYFRQYLRVLLESVWYGRYAVQNRYSRRRDRRTGRIQYTIDRWTPISGDKLVFRYDDGSGHYDPEQVGVRVSPAWVRDDVFAGHPDLEFAHDGAILFFQRWQRRRIVLHKHMIRDGEFEDPLSGSQIHGVGLRNWLYWSWYQKQETMAQLVETVEKTASGITVYYYPDGNDAARDRVTQLAENAAHDNVLILPYDPTDPGSYSVQQIPANTQGIAALQNLIDNYFGDWILRLILGQTLSQRADATGLGSGNSDLQHDSLKQIIKFDATNLEETVSREMVDPLKRLNFPRYSSARFCFRLHTESNIPQDELAAIETGWNMGLKLRAADVYDKIGVSEPSQDDEAIFNPQVRQAIEAAAAPQMGAGMPPGMAQPMGGPDPIAQPPGAMPISLPGQETPPQQMQQADPEQARRQKIFGPILNKRARANWDAIDWTNRVVRYAKRRARQSPQPRRYAVRHAPAGGVTIGGVEYPGGRFIPDEALSQATPQELKQLQGSQAHQVDSHEAMSQLPEGFAIHKTDGSRWEHQGNGLWDNTTGLGDVWGPAESSQIWDEETAERINQELSKSHKSLVQHATDNDPDRRAAQIAAEKAKRYDPKQIKPHEALDELPEGTQIGPWTKQAGFWHHNRSKAILSSMSAAHGKQALDADTLGYAATIVAKQRQQQDAEEEQRKAQQQQQQEQQNASDGTGSEAGGDRADGPERDAAADVGATEPQATQGSGGAVDTGAGGPGQGADAGGDAAEAEATGEAGEAGSVDAKRRQQEGRMIPTGNPDMDYDIEDFKGDIYEMKGEAPPIPRKPKPKPEGKEIQTGHPGIDYDVEDLKGDIMEMQGQSAPKQQQDVDPNDNIQAPKDLGKQDRAEQPGQTTTDNPNQPKKTSDVGSLEGLPPGSTITDRDGLKWEKQPPHEAFPKGIWTVHPDSRDEAAKRGIESTAMTHERMAGMVDPDTVQAAVTPDTQQQVPGTHQAQQQALWNQHGDDLKELAQSFGIEAFDGHQRQRVQAFLSSQAREAGYEPQGANATEKAIDAARHLAGNIHHYQGVVDYARGLGFNGNAKRLGAQFRQSGQALIRMANQTGANIDPMRAPSEQLGAAISHLQRDQDTGEQGSGVMGIVDQLANAVGGRRNLAVIAGVLFATFAFYRLMDSWSK